MLTIRLKVYVESLPAIDALQGFDISAEEELLRITLVRVVGYN